jgi:hypothetical protein
LKNSLHRKDAKDAKNLIFYKIGRSRFYEGSSRQQRIKYLGSADVFSIGVLFANGKTIRCALGVFAVNWAF